MLRLIGNILWFIFFGLTTGLSWLLLGCLMIIFIITIPWAKACFTIGWFVFWPFGREAVSREELSGEEDIGTGPLGVIGNVIWFVFAGIWLAIAHILMGITCFITIIGIPFGLQHIKLAVLALFPIGKTIVSIEEAQDAHRDAVISRED